MVDPSANRRGILAMVGCMACFSVNDAFMKLAAAHLPISQTIALRSVVAVALLLVAVIVIGQVRDLVRTRRPLVMLRGFIEALTSFCFITALSQLPLADISAITLSTPLIITALSGPLLGETVGWRRWSAVIVGFVGVLLVAKPFGAGFSVYTLLAFTSACLTAGRDLLTRHIDPAIPSHTITFATTAAVMLFASGVAAVQAAAGLPWRPMDATTLAWVAGAGLFVVIGNHLVVIAFRGVDVSVVSPFRYSIIVWAVLIGAIVFGERPDAYSAAGAALVVGAGLYTLHREQVRAREAARARARASDVRPSE